MTARDAGPNRGGIPAPPPRLRLTRRQRQVAELVARGEPNKLIAEELGVGEQAVKSLVSRLLAKFRVGNRVLLVKVLAASGLAGHVESEAAELRGWLAHVPAFIAILRGPTLVVEFASAEVLRSLGRREIIGKTMRAAFPELTDRGVIQILDGCYRSGGPVSRRGVAARLDLRGNGTLEQRIFNLVIEPLRARAPAVSGLAVFALDVTEPARLRALLAQATGQLLTTRDREIGVMVIDSEHRILHLNEVARRLLWWHEKDPASPTWDPLRCELRDLLSGRTFGGEASPCGRALRGQEVLNELFLFRPPGADTEGIAQVSASAVRDHRGIVTGAVLTFTQVAEAK